MNCIICETEFQPKDKRTKWCSKECHKVVKNNRWKEKHSYKPEPKQCVICSNEFLPRNSRHKTCSLECSSELNYINCQASFKKRYEEDEEFRRRVLDRSKKYKEAVPEEEKEARKQYHRNYHWENREQLLRKKKEYYETVYKHKLQANREEINKKKRKRWAEDPAFKLRRVFTNRLYWALKSQDSSKYDNSLKLLGCTVQELKQYIESKFEEGMSWENYSYYGWHLDHIRPCASFDLTDPEQQRQCFHYTNLQPLWAEDNLKKGCKYVNRD